MSIIKRLCPICNREFTNLWKHFWESHKESNLTDYEFLAKYLKLNYVPLCSNLSCNNKCQIIYKKYEFSKYCSRSCISKLNKQKQSLYYKVHPGKRRLAEINSELNPRYCLDCGLKLKGTTLGNYCRGCIPKHRVYTKDSRSKLHEAGVKSIQLQGNSRRSRAEMLFYELCKNKFNKVLHNEPMFNGWDADVIIVDLKVAILWNGVWHYKKITKNHSVEQTQNRDKIKIKEIMNFGYTPYVIKDEGKFNKNKVIYEFNNFLNKFNISAG